MKIKFSFSPKFEKEAITRLTDKQKRRDGNQEKMGETNVDKIK